MATTNPINGVPFGQEKTREDYLARAAWEYDQASRLRMAQRPVGYTALVEGHERAAKEYERAAEGRPSVPTSRVSLRTPLQEKLRGRRKRSHATKRDRADDLIASYGTWTQSYSNEDRDRAQGLANRLTEIDREEGRSAPPVGFSKARYAQAQQVVEDANRYGAKQQSLRAGGRTHARKKKISPREAKQLLQSDGIDFRRDFHELSSSEVQRVLEVAHLASYRKSKNAPGSTARMYFQYLDRLK